MSIAVGIMMFLMGFLACVALQVVGLLKLCYTTAVTRRRKLQAGNILWLTLENEPLEYWEFSILRVRDDLCLIRYGRDSIDIPSILLETHPQLELKRVL